MKDFWKCYGDERKVIDREHVPGYTEYYVPGGRVHGTAVYGLI